MEISTENITLQNAAKPLRIGLTGGIGSGKSVVAQIFETLGIPVFYADDEAKRLMNTDAGLRENIITTFGTDTYTGTTLNRQMLAAKVFGNSFELEKLNAIVHPATIAMAGQWFQQQHTPYAVKEAALLFEAGTAAGLDFVVGVQSPQHLRIQRAMRRDNISREQVMQRIGNQIDDSIKMKLCDYVLVNDEQHLLITQVLSLHEIFIHKQRYTKQG